MNLKDQILNAAGRLKTERVEVPEWADAHGRPAVIVIREMGGKARCQWYADHEHADTGTFRATLLSYCVHDPETGAKLFELSDVPALSDGSHEVLDRLYDIAAKLNGLGLKAEAAVAKNS